MAFHPSSPRSAFCIAGAEGPPHSPATSFRAESTDPPLRHRNQKLPPPPHPPPSRTPVFVRQRCPFYYLDVETRCSTVR